MKRRFRTLWMVVLVCLNCGFLGGCRKEEATRLAAESQKEIQAAEGKTYQDVTALRDPLIGLGFETETAGSLTVDYNPYHDPSNGRFTTGGGGGKIGKTKYAPSPQRSQSGIHLGPKRYAKLTGVLNCWRGR